MSNDPGSGVSEETGETTGPQPPEGDPTGALDAPPRRYNRGGLIVVAILFAGGILATRDPDMKALAIPYFTSATALLIRSFFPEMTWGRGVLVGLGGYCAGMVVFMLSIVRFHDLATVIGPTLFGLVLLWSGFKRGKIKWKKEKR